MMPMPKERLLRQVPDYLARKDASNDLAHRIRQFWAECGASVDVRVEATQGIGGTSVFAHHVIRSNLKNGLPPGFRRTRNADDVAIAQVARVEVPA